MLFSALCTNTCPAKAIRTKECECLCNTGNPGKPTVIWDGVSECKGGDDFKGKCHPWNKKQAQLLSIDEVVDS